MDTYGYGSYAASIKAARAPFSITGIFPYAPPDFHTKIGVEIFNDENGRVLFNTYADGKQINTVEKNFPFDATAAFHEYRIDLYPTRAEFSVDGRLLHTFEKGLPGDSMKLMVNAWYPDWLPARSPRPTPTPKSTGSKGKKRRRDPITAPGRAGTSRGPRPIP